MYEEVVVDMQNVQVVQVGKFFIIQQCIDYFFFFIWWFCWCNIQFVMWGGDEIVELLFEVFWLVNYIDYYGVQMFEFIFFNLVWMFVVGEVWIVVVFVVEIVFQYIVGEVVDQVVVVWFVEVDGVVQGGFVGYVVVWEFWWNIEDVVWLQIFINDWWEWIDVQQCWMWIELMYWQFVIYVLVVVVYVLNNKDVILIDMWVDIVVGDGEGDYQVVQVLVWQYVEWMYQFGGRYMLVVYCLGQQGLIGFVQFVEMFKRIIVGLLFVVFQVDQLVVDFWFYG